MTDIVGILNKEEEEVFGQKADALIDFNKFKGDNRWANLALALAEKKDDSLFTAGIRYLDNTLGEKIPLDIKPSARAVAVAIINNDIEAFESSAAVLINMLVDIPTLTEDTEAIIIAGVLRGIIDAFRVYLKKE